MTPTEKPKNIIISIRPKYARKIIAGEKTVELRRRFPVESVKGGIALIYASSPVQEIIGYTVIKKVDHLPLDELWKKYHRQACVEESFFFEYFNGLNQGFALQLKSPVKLIKPVDINRMQCEFLLSVPQSFRYAPDSIVDCVAT